MSEKEDFAKKSAERRKVEKENKRAEREDDG